MSEPTSVADEAPNDNDVREFIGSQAKREWIRPEVAQLPRLSDLTLVTGEGIGGGESLFP